MLAWPPGCVVRAVVPGVGRQAQGAEAGVHPRECWGGRVGAREWAGGVAGVPLDPPPGAWRPCGAGSARASAVVGDHRAGRLGAAAGKGGAAAVAPIPAAGPPRDFCRGPAAVAAASAGIAHRVARLRPAVPATAPVLLLPRSTTWYSPPGLPAVPDAPALPGSLRPRPAQLGPAAALLRSPLEPGLGQMEVLVAAMQPLQGGAGVGPHRAVCQLQAAPWPTGTAPLHALGRGVAGPGLHLLAQELLQHLGRGAVGGGRPVDGGGVCSRAADGAAPQHRLAWVLGFWGHSWCPREFPGAGRTDGRGGRGEPAAVQALGGAGQGPQAPGRLLWVLHVPVAGARRAGPGLQPAGSSLDAPGPRAPAAARAVLPVQEGPMVPRGAAGRRGPRRGAAGGRRGPCRGRGEQRGLGAGLSEAGELLGARAQAGTGRQGEPGSLALPPAPGMRGAGARPASATGYLSGHRHIPLASDPQCLIETAVQGLAVGSWWEMPGLLAATQGRGVCL